jgi:hypothetical protein
LYGQAGTDRLDGGGDSDGLFGGVGGDDLLFGGLGSDRFLVWNGTRVVDATGNDARLLFKNASHGWTDAEIEAIDSGLYRLHLRTFNSLLMNDSLSTDPIVFEKHRSLENGAVASNTLIVTERRENRNGREIRTVTYERIIKFADWNENDSWEHQFRTWATIHEMGHNWDSREEIGNRLPGSERIWNSFLAQSSWRESDPHSNEYRRSGDSQWWHRNSAVFVRDYSRQNPAEDWSTVWEIMFDPMADDARSRVALKVSIVDQLFDALRG